VTSLLLLCLILAPRAGASVYWANNGGTTVGRANNDGTAVNQAFIGGVSVPCGVASDGVHVYWTDRAARAIGRASIDGTGVNPHFITGVDSCGLALDAAHIYWDNLDTGSVGRANLDGTAVNRSFIPAVAATFGVAVDRAHVYWSTFGSVGRANLDGSGANQNFIALDPLTDQGCGVAVDAGHVYWANDLGTIGRANLDGSGADPSFVRAAPARTLTCGVAVDSAHLYWAHSAVDAPDPANDGIGRANLDGTGVNQTFITGTSFPMSVAVDGAGTIPSDTTPPTVTTAPTPAFVANTDVTAGRVPVRISWAATDAGSGVCTYQLQESVGGGAFTNVSLPTATSTKVTREELPGTSYRYQVRATDCAGNASTLRLGRQVTVRAFQETSSAIGYSSGWTTIAQAGAFGASVNTATAPASTATFSFSGALAVAWVSTKDASSGGAHALLDNTTSTAVNLNGATTLPGRLVYVKRVSASAAHTVRVSADGTTGRPKTTVDAFVVIQ
jgi:hypothetical protein